MSKFLIVVSRYCENVNWSKQFQDVLIYNKGKPMNENYNEIMLTYM